MTQARAVRACFCLALYSSLRKDQCTHMDGVWTIINFVCQKCAKYVFLHRFLVLARIEIILRVAVGRSCVFFLDLLNTQASIEDVPFCDIDIRENLIMF